MSDAPSKSNADIDKPRRGIGRFLWLNAVATSLGTLAVALTFDNVFLLYPIAFGMLVGGMLVIFREMFQLLGEDSQYQVDEVAPATEADSNKPVAKVGVGATPHAA